MDFHPAHVFVSKGYVIGVGVHLLYVCDQRKCLNGTSAVNSPFQTLLVDFSLNLFASSTMRALEMLSS